MEEERRDYESFLVRLWREGGPRRPWRASATNVRTGEVVRFASPEALHAYLSDEPVPAAEPD